MWFCLRGFFRGGTCWGPGKNGISGSTFSVRFHDPHRFCWFTITMIKAHGFCLAQWYSTSHTWIQIILGAFPSPNLNNDVESPKTDLPLGALGGPYPYYQPLPSNTVHLAICTRLGSTPRFSSLLPYITAIKVSSLAMPSKSLTSSQRKMDNWQDENE